MKLVKIFNKEWDADNLEEKINAFSEENDEIIINKIQYRMSKGYHSALVEYSTTVNLH